MLKDQSDLLSVFNAHDVRYLVVGGDAVNTYTQPRSTKDLDVWIDATEENSFRVFRALAAFGAPMSGLSKLLPDRRGPDRIDVLHRLSGVEFERAWEASVPGVVEAIPRPVYR